MPQYRALSLETWDAVERDLDQLLSGSTANGNWNLAETARHLNDWLSYSMDGYPRAVLPVRIIMGLMRVSMGRSMLRRILDQGFTDGRPTMPATVHRAAASEDRAAVEELRATVRRFREYRGEIAMSPLFGRLDRPTAERLQLRHFEHHLSLLVPRS